MEGGVEREEVAGRARVVEERVEEAARAKAAKWGQFRPELLPSSGHFIMINRH